MPWQNGQGVTTELAIGPQGAMLGDFDWRISMARVDADSRFSRFPGIDRSLAVLGGQGLRLHVGTAPSTTLLPEGEPIMFSGETDVRAEVLAGPTTDLNIMTRRGRWSHVLQRATIMGTHRITDVWDCLFVYCSPGSAPCSCRNALGQTIVLAASEAAMIDDTAGQPVELVAESGATVYLARLILQPSGG